MTSPREAEVLLKLERKYSVKSNIRRRCQVVIGRTVDNKRRVDLHNDGMSYPFIDRWSVRWQNSYSDRLAWAVDHGSELDNDRLYMAHIEEVLSDAYRSGTPAKFDAAKREQIVALATTKPRDLNLPFDTWSLELLRHELVKRGIVEDISLSRIGIFLKRPSSSAPLE